MSITAVDPSDAAARAAIKEALDETLVVEAAAFTGNERLEIAPGDGVEQQANAALCPELGLQRRADGFSSFRRQRVAIERSKAGVRAFQWLELRFDLGHLAASVAVKNGNAHAGSRQAQSRSQAETARAAEDHGPILCSERTTQRSSPSLRPEPTTLRPASRAGPPPKSPGE